MYSNQNNGRSQRRPQKRYNPNESKAEKFAPLIIALVIFVVGFAVGGFVSVGIYKAANPAQTTEEAPVLPIDPGIFNSSSTDSTDSPVSTEPKEPTDRLICIDPGHGFADGGTADSDYINAKTEAELNMDFAKRLEAALLAKGFRVVLTHDGKTIPSGYDYDGDNIYSAADSSGGQSVSERRDYAMAQKPDYFISIHCDSFSDESVKGMRIYYPIDNESSSLAIDSLIARMAVVSATYPNSTARKFSQELEAAYAVTKNWGSVPAMLVELGFVTNKDDADCLQDPEWGDAVAEAFAKGIVDYFS